MIALLTGDVISGLGRPLANEIPKPTLLMNEKSQIFGVSESAVPCDKQNYFE
jgi:hypothetical protein